MISAYFFVCLLVVAPLMLFVSGTEILTSSGTRAEVKGIASPEHFSASMRGSAVHVPAFVASKGSSGDLKRDPESVKEAVSTTYTLVGSYSLESGPAWSSVPPAYSCQAACAVVFGGVASDYAGSISDVSITNTCYYDKYAGSTTSSTLLSASFSSCATYVSGCYSAYVQDHTTIQPTKNFCYSSKVVAVPTAKPTVKPTLKPTTAPSNVLTPNAYRGSFLVSNGPYWGSYPPTYTCQQACALLFGGSPSDFQGSTSSSSITNTCYAQQYAGTQYPYLIPDTYSNCTTYSTAGCMSTYVADAFITVTNYCFNHK